MKKLEQIERRSSFSDVIQIENDELLNFYKKNKKKSIFSKEKQNLFKEEKNENLNKILESNSNFFKRFTNNEKNDDEKKFCFDEIFQNGFDEIKKKKTVNKKKKKNLNEKKKFNLLKKNIKKKKKLIKFI